MKIYLLVYSDTLGTREQVKEYLNQIPIVADWRFELPSSFFILSEATARELSEELRKKNGEKGFLLITEVHESNYWGWLTEESWYLIQNKTRKPKS